MILDIIPDEDKTVEVCVDGVMLRTIEDVRAILPIRCPAQHRIVLVSGLFVTAMDTGEPGTAVSPIPWEKVPALRHRADVLLRDYRITYEPCNVLNGVRPLYDLRTLSRHVFDAKDWSTLRVIRVVHARDPEAPEPVLDTGLASVLLRDALTQDAEVVTVVGVANVVLEDFGSGRDAIPTHARDDRDFIPAWFKNAVPNKLVSMPTLFPWNKTAPVLYVGRSPAGHVRVLGTLLQPWASAWYRVWMGRAAQSPPMKHMMIFNGYPMVAVSDNAPENLCFMFGSDMAECRGRPGDVHTRPCAIDPDLVLVVREYDYDDA